MKKILLALAFIGCMFAAHAQEKPSTGDLYDGLTRPLTFNRVIPPYALEVTFSKTVHVIFPSAIRYVDLGDRKSTRLNSSHMPKSRMPSSA